MLDYIIVGLGLSGIAVAEELEKRGKKFVVFDNDSQKSSYVAGGIFNPVILKRFTLAWKADEQMKFSLPFYKSLEDKLQLRFVNYWDIYRRFHSVEEQNNWYAASDKARLSPFLDSDLRRNKNPNLIAPFSLGRMRGTGNIDTETLLASYASELAKKSAFKREKFDYDELERNSDGWHYKDFKSEKVIFCDGFGLKKNPYFNYLPLHGNKGEYITIYSEDLKLDIAVKSHIFMMPLGNDLYKVGATYNPKDLDPEPTAAAREKLVFEIKNLIKCDFEVVDQSAGIRPSVADRRPLIGEHPERSGLYCCNGFGSRGVLLAPKMANELISFAEGEGKLDPEANIDRYTQKYYKN